MLVGRRLVLRAVRSERSPLGLVMPLPFGLLMVGLMIDGRCCRQIIDWKP